MVGSTGTPGFCNLPYHWRRHPGTLLWLPQILTESENDVHDAARLLEQHSQTLVNDNESWKKLIADAIVWELPYAPALGHPLSLDGRNAVKRHVGWFLSAVENFRFYDMHILPGLDPNSAVAEVKAEGIIKPTGRVDPQEYVVFLRAAGGKITFLREYFDPVRAAHAFAEPLHDLGE